MFAKLKAIWNLASGGIVTARNVFVVLFSLATGWTKLHTMGARAVLIAVLLGIGYLFKSTLFLSGGWFVTGLVVATYWHKLMHDLGFESADSA